MRPRRCRFGQRRQIAPDILFRIIEMGQIDALCFRKVILDQFSPLNLVIDGIGDHAGGNVKERTGLTDEHISPKTTVTLIAGGLRQNKAHTCAGSDGRRRLNAYVLRNGVGGFEADAANVLGKAVRILLDDLDGILSVLLVDANGFRRAHAMSVQKNHDLANDPLIRPPGRDLLDALRTDTAKPFQTFRLFLDGRKTMISRMIL